jgi:hypothetical protein
VAYRTKDELIMLFSIYTVLYCTMCSVHSTKYMVLFCVMAHHNEKSMKLLVQ